MAEDDRGSRRLLVATLKKLGFESDACGDGLEAWDVFQQARFHIVVSDWMMPEMDGLEFCRKIREHEKKDYTYFILLTANAQTRANYRAAIRAGIDDFLVKPLDTDEIGMRLHVAERILRYASRIKQLESLLPICSYCKRIRNDGDYWEQVESYISETTGARFSHSICPSCYTEHVQPELDRLRAESL